MNLDIIVDLIKQQKADKFETRDLLTEQFKLKGFNIFQAAEKAENNIRNFVEDIQRIITESHNNNEMSLFKEATQSITIVNRNYFIVLDLRNQLQNLKWQDFEDLCGVLMRKCFKAESISITKRSGDGGVDFMGKIPFKSEYATAPFTFIELYGQAKRYSGNVDRPDVQNFTGVANGQKKTINILRNYLYFAQHLTLVLRQRTKSKKTIL
ncbi:MAG: restriction endonuclease [Nitrospirae bacterium]|nr:restriction endonuclease [Nitrospirota bacterium]